MSIMWEKLKVYHQLDTKDIPSTFRALGSIIAEGLSDSGFVLTSTSSTIKLFKEDNDLEFSVFLLREKGGYYFDVKTSIKPVHFHHKHKFTMTNIKTLGEVLDNYRRNRFPLTKEFELLVVCPPINRTFEQFGLNNRLSLQYLCISEMRPTVDSHTEGCVR